MRHILCIVVAVASPAFAEVKSSTATGFEVERSAVVPASPAEIYAQIGRPAEWWDAAHSYSGKAENISLELRAGGCFCERLANGGSVEHGRIVFADPASAIRLDGALGPLQAEAVTGRLTWSFKQVAGGTQLTQTYVVGGSVRAGNEAIAPIVDQVMGGQFDRLRSKLGG